MSPIDLVALQTSLLELVKRRKRTTAVDDPYLRLVEGSEHLALIWEIAHWWRAVAIERSAPLTSALLKQRGVFDEAVATATSSPDANPFRERQTDVFLHSLCRHPDPLIAAVAGFERALLAARFHGAADRFEVIWPCNPYEVLHNLMTGTPVEQRPEQLYRVEVSGDIPGGFRVQLWQAR